ncbi:centrosomal protein of 152 kDa isoform X2 [Lissotriton helveticus]
MRHRHNYSSQLFVYVYCLKMNMCCNEAVASLNLYEILAEALEEDVYSMRGSLMNLKQLLTDLPHDLLDDSRDLSSPELNSSDCSVSEVPSGGHQPWQHETSWNKLHPVAISQGGYVDEHSGALEPHTNLNEPGHHFGHHLDIEKHTNGWSDHQSEDEEGSVYDINYSYPRRRSKDDPEENAYDAVHDFKAEDTYQQSAIFHIPEDFQPYTNGLRDEFIKPQDELSTFPDIRRENLQHLTVPGYAKHHPVESFQVQYNPYQGAMHHRAQETRVDESIEEMQKEFLNSDSADRMQIAQLQVLYKARGRQLEEMNVKLEESGREMRCLNHQLAMIKAEKDGLTMSLQESQKLFQNGQEREAQLDAQIKVLETNIQALTANEEQMCKKLQSSEVALEDMQRQLIDLRRSDTLKRAREQHESFVSSLKQKSEEQLLQLQQKLDAANTALQEQKEHCSFLEDHVKQLERKQEEGKLEKNEIINRLTRSLEESQRQCANLLQTGTIQETTQLRFQIQQAQSSKIINDNMNKALQEELTELKEQVALYESAAKLGVYLNGTCAEAQLSESYVDLGIQNVNWKKSRFHSTLRKRDPPVNLTKDEIIMELKVELERSLSSNKIKRNQVSQLQQNIKEHQDKIEELKKQLEKTERTARDYEVRADSMEKHMDTFWPYSSAPNEGLNEAIQKLKNENLALQKQVEKHLSTIEELTQKEESLKSKNQELCNEMRQMIEDFDHDKQEAIDRCERTYQQHHEDIKNHFQKELSDKFEAEKEKLGQLFEEQMLELQAQLHQKDQELTTVQECYITLCREKDSFEDTLKNKMLHEFTETEQKLKELLLKEKEETIRTLMEKHQNELATARSQWVKDKEAELKREVEAQVAIAETIWQVEQKKVMERAVLNTEKDWHQRLNNKVKEKNTPVVLEHKNVEIQTEPNEATDPSCKEVIEELQLKLQNSLHEKEKAVRQAVLDLEIQHLENISNQVEAAVNNAHTRWLQELTSLAEYKAAVRAEQEKWEQESKLTVANQISAVVMAAEEKWKQEHLNADKPLINGKQKELEEKITLLTREIESKNEEHTARLKAELAKARAEWNKEKQEEINKMRAQNEKDYRTFLDSHRNKINEVLAQAKDDFERQKKELLSQKKTEIMERIEQNRKQWVTEESKKLQQQEEDILISIQYFLDLIHLDLVKGSNDKSTLKEKAPTVKLSSQYQEKLMECLQKSCQEIVCRSLENAMHHWRKISAVVMAAEEKWKQEHLNADKPLINGKQKELEEKITLLTREIESKNEEHTARLKAELAKARAEWNKEKQEEINKMRAQNEKDYRTFLDSHRNKINEVLAQAKDDFERQKKELLSQKKTEIMERIEQNRKQWVTEESKKLQQQEEDILISIQYFLDLIHLDLVKGSNDKSTLKEKAPTVKLSSQYQEKLMECLQKSCQEIVCRSLENAMHHWRKKNGVHPHDQRTGARDYHRTSHADETEHKSYTHQMKISDPLNIDYSGSKSNLESQANCCEHCLRELEKSRSECQELKSKLEKACRHLQLAVKEHNARREQIKENETIIEALKNENYEVQKKIGEINACVGTSSSQFEGASGTTSCCGRGLEEMRSQYIIAVDKIRDDMIRYIQESRERAAEMLKAEVLRERQETARKMRKYYLICLQQLLKDDGKHEGAEKKIMNAASKLATMAKVLESPMTHKSHNRHAQSARSQKSEATSGIQRVTNRDRISTEQTASKFRDKEDTPHTMEPKLKGGVSSEVRSASPEEGALLVRNQKGLKDGLTLGNGIKMADGATEQNRAHSEKATSRHKPASCISKTKLQSLPTFSWLDGLSDSDSDRASFQTRTRQARCLPNHLTAAPATAASERSSRFDIQETPV